MDTFRQNDLIPYRNIHNLMRKFLDQDLNPASMDELEVPSCPSRHCGRPGNVVECKWSLFQITIWSAAEDFTLARTSFDPFHLTIQKLSVLSHPK
ncbi:hypothetical protein Hamer_G020135 [Homarus americanus]|uniref:Uncharacterized protein n=1 Tax=Homarus americanus TaxID=6706 RepID=A0A8J5N517_HOMAM|nr:hypothetical protein Hamer_G020135 [Homarus americanus]